MADELRPQIDVYEIEHYEGLNRTPALRLALKAQIELLNNVFCEPLLNVYWDHRAIVVFSAGLPIGVITYSVEPGLKQVNIALAYVEPDFRGRGAYSLMWKALIEKAREAGIKYISSSTHRTNTRMVAIAERQGRRRLGYLLGYEIPQE